MGTRLEYMYMYIIINQYGRVTSTSTRVVKTYIVNLSLTCYNDIIHVNPFAHSTMNTLAIPRLLPSFMHGLHPHFVCELLSRFRCALLPSMCGLLPSFMCGLLPSFMCGVLPRLSQGEEVCVNSWCGSNPV